MITIGIPPIEKWLPPRRLSRWQKYLLGKKCYDNLMGIFSSRKPQEFKTLPERERREWIQLALQ